jgi:hypothetical protein
MPASGARGSPSLAPKLVSLAQSGSKRTHASPLGSRSEHPSLSPGVLTHTYASTMSGSPVCAVGGRPRAAPRRLHQAWQSDTRAFALPLRAVSMRMWGEAPTHCSVACFRRVCEGSKGE